MTDAISLGFSVWLRLIACAQVHLSSSSPVFIGEVPPAEFNCKTSAQKNISACVDVGVGGCMHVLACTFRPSRLLHC